MRGEEKCTDNTHIYFDYIDEVISINHIKRYEEFIDHQPHSVFFHAFKANKARLVDTLVLYYFLFTHKQTIIWDHMHVHITKTGNTQTNHNGYLYFKPTLTFNTHKHPTYTICDRSFIM